jgi:hypothetical protein
MKELNQQTRIKQEQEVELSIKKKQEIDYVLLGSLRPQKGHKLFECNISTGVVKEAEYDKPKDIIGYINSIKFVENKKLIVHPDCIYIPALNLKNAKKKFMMNREQSNYFVKPPILKL